MKFKLWLLVVLLVCGMVYAECKNINECQEQFELNPNPGSFNQLTNPSVEDLVKVTNPTSDNFKKLNLLDQRSYLIKKPNSKFAEIYLTQSVVDFKNKDDQKIAKEFFDNQVDNINSHQAVFSQYMSSQGVNIKLQGKIDSYSEGLVSTKKQTINILEWKDQFDFLVKTNGELFLIDKKTKNNYGFEGKIENKKGKLYLKSGKIALIDDPRTQNFFQFNEIIEGSFTFKNGKLIGEAKCFGGICFDKVIKDSLSYDFDTLSLTKTLVVSEIKTNANIKIDAGLYSVQVKKGDLDLVDKARVTIEEGKVTYIDTDKGKITEKGGIVYLNGVGVKGDLNVYYDKTGTEKNYVLFKKEEIEIKGKGLLLFDKEELKNLYKKLGKDVNSAYATKFFVGTPSRIGSDSYDYFKVLVNQGQIKISIKADKLAVDFKGNGVVKNGYWQVGNKDGKLYQGIDGDAVAQKGGSLKKGYIGFDTVQMEIKGDWKNNEKGAITILDRKGRADLILVPFGYTGISNGDLPQTQEEFREYIVWYGELLQGYPYDRGEHVYGTGPRHPLEGYLTGINFVCTDVSDVIGLAMGDVDLGPRMVLAKGSRSFGRWAEAIAGRIETSEYYVEGSYTYTKINEIDLKSKGKKELDEFFTRNNFKKGDMITISGPGEGARGHTMMYSGEDKNGDPLIIQTSGFCPSYVKKVSSVCEMTLKSYIQKRGDFKVTGKLSPFYLELLAAKNKLEQQKLTIVKTPIKVALK